jgi:hypothetical protein
MKADEIYVGQKVYIKEAGRSTRILGRGIVKETHVKSVNSRIDSTKVWLCYYPIDDDEKWEPRFEVDYSRNGTDPKTGRRWVDESKPIVQTYLNAQLISKNEMDRRREEDRKANEEIQRRRQLVNDMRENVAQALFKAGVAVNDVRVSAKYMAPVGDVPEGVEVTSIGITGEGVKALLNFIYRELDFMEDEEEEVPA